MRFHYVAAGRGDLVLLLHGFPEFWYSWRFQIPELAKYFRVVAPDLRGYNETEKRGPYNMATLTTDIRDIVRALGYERAHIVGHDWGGAIAFATSALYPDLVNKLVVLNAPHAPALVREFRRNWRQRFKSWYIAAFQIPFLPELILGSFNAWGIRAMLRAGARDAQTFSDADLRAYADAILKPGALRATIGYYRALRTRQAMQSGRAFRNIAAPTLILWGEKDIALEVGLTRDLEQWIPNLRVKYFPNAGHWLQQEEPDAVNAQIVEFLRG
ncbi:MAG: alpha/beta hydrolase [Chloroflexi bacterium]|nr:alpha/beta hydrolase [Chloroflexota bacterium]